MSAVVEQDRPEVRVFLSYASQDVEVAERMWDLLDTATRVDGTYRFSLWRFRLSILVGEDWDDQIRAALAASQLGVFAISNAFLASRYIAEVELPALIDVPGKRAIPVMLQEPSPHADLKGLENLQVYGRRRPFGELTRQAARQQWVNGLVDQIHRVLARYGTSPAATR